MRTAPENEAKIVKGNKCPHNCHTTTRRQKRGECCREGKSVRKCDFCNVCGVLVLLLLLFFNDKAFENQWSYSPHSPPPHPALVPWPPSLFAECPPWKLGFPKKDKQPKGTSDSPPEGRLCPWVDRENHPPPPPRPRPVWFYKAETPGLSNHTFWASIRNCYISVFPSCYGLSRFRDQLRITAKRLSQQKARAGEVHNASTLALTHSSGGKIK